MTTETTAPNAKRLLWAGFFSILAAGVGFSVRAGILGDWAKAYDFTMTELGGITGGGLWGFGIIILLGSLIADRVGYGVLMGSAFLMHVVSAAMTLATGVIFEKFGHDAAYWNLFVAMFLFAIGNGLCEVVVNPMVATLFPREKTHYLNLLHAGWPGGLIAGGIASYFLSGNVHWMAQMSLFLIPVAIYGGMMLGQKFPTSEASQAGVDYGTMLVQFASPILILLLILHALVGYVELGTDSWIGKITGSIMANPARGMALFVYTSGLMFALRFFAGPIERLTTPLGLLCISGVLGATGLMLLSNAEGVIFCVLAATVYACGKTFLWPTMLAVASERFPRGGAIVIGAMGGVGMLSAGLIGTKVIGMQQDHFAAQDLQREHKVTVPVGVDADKKVEETVNGKEIYDRYKADKPDSFYGLFPVQGLSGSKVAIMEEGTVPPPKDADAEKKAKFIAERDKEVDKTVKQAKLEDWWAKNKATVEVDKQPIEASRLYGGRQALMYTAAVPATMAVLYLLLVLYFMTQGGYKPVVIESERTEPRPESRPMPTAAATPGGIQSGPGSGHT